jgi:hypothetical protein
MGRPQIAQHLRGDLGDLYAAISQRILNLRNLKRLQQNLSVVQFAEPHIPLKVELTTRRNNGNIVGAMDGPKEFEYCTKAMRLNVDHI